MEIKHSELAAINTILRMSQENLDKVFGAYASIDSEKLFTFQGLREAPRGITVELIPTRKPHDQFRLMLFSSVLAYPDYSAVGYAQKMKFNVTQPQAIEAAKQIVRREVNRFVLLADFVKRAPEVDIDRLVLRYDDAADMPNIIRAMDG